MMLIATPASAADRSPDETAPIAVPDRTALEFAYAQGKLKAADRNGIMLSLYQGKWFMPTRERVRRCIAYNESHGDYRAVSADARYRGAYQMNRKLAIGASWMMQREVVKEMGQAGKAIVEGLRKKPTQQWNRYWQDRAFWTIFRHGKGKSHWMGADRKCMNLR